MTAKLDPQNNFIEGIYNYCDRWCERCNMTGQCLLFSIESERRANHLAIGKDPDDLDTIMNDVRATLQETKKMILGEASSLGINVEELKEEKRTDTSFHPLHISAKALSFRIHHFRDKLAKVLNEEKETGTAEETLRVLQEAFEVLAWYEFLFYVKIQRALQPIVSNEKDELGLYDANGSAKVAWIGLSRCVDALTRIAEILPWMHQEVVPLLDDAYQLIELLDHTIPDYKVFKRPGFEH